MDSNQIEEDSVSINTILQACREIVSELAEAYETELEMLIWENSLPEKRDWLNEIMTGNTTLDIIVERIQLKFLEEEMEDHFFYWK